MKTVLLVKPETDTRVYYEEHNHREGDAGFDIFCPENITINPGETKRVNMKVKCVFRNVEENKGIHYFLTARSSIDKTPLMLSNGVGTMDKNYRGYVIASLRHVFPDKPPYKIERGQRLVQIVPITGDDFDVKIVEELDKTNRGEGGFGSTGI